MTRSMSNWINAKKEVPNSEVGAWSPTVVAVCDLGCVYKLSHIGNIQDGCWQRTEEFVKNGSRYVAHWMPLPELE